MWKAQLRLNELSGATDEKLVTFKFAKGCRMKHKKWAVYQDSRVFRIKCKREGDLYTTNSNTLQEIRLFLIGNLVRTEYLDIDQALFDFDAWKARRITSWGRQYIDNEHELWFGKASELSATIETRDGACLTFQNGSGASIEIHSFREEPDVLPHLELKSTIRN
jgi:hypothetical protein